ncbi:hypothetical protein FACS189485_08610 [Spirochaetia bacterium]|nr:hypothetical protein FACS189485_08610 [Spirochaetia bacterium]
MKSSLKMAAMVAAIATILAVMPAAAQTPPPPTSTDMWGLVDTLTDGYDAVKTQSTEARYSAGRFGSYVDDFISVNDYDPNVGTFVFMGGYKAADYVPGAPPSGTVDDTDDVTGAFPLDDSFGPHSPYAVSLGFAKSFNSFYLAGYYAGHGIWGSGNNNRADPETITATGQWKNNLAILFGNAAIGGIRFDLILDGDVNSATYDGNVPSSGNDSDVTMMTAFTWGKPIGKLIPHATLGIKWPKYSQEGDSNGKEMTTWTDGALLVKAGTDIPLKDNALLSFDLTGAGTFGTSQTGDLYSDKYSSEGDFYLGVDAGYSNKINFGEKVAVGFKTPVTIGLLIDGEDTTYGSTTTDLPNDIYFGLKAGVELGFQFKLTQKIALYTGAGLTLFDWTTLSHSGGDTEDKTSDWNINGIQWDGSKGSSKSSIGLGMTIAPVENLSIGFGLNTILDQLIIINVPEMNVKLGDFWSNFDPFGGNFFGGLLSDSTSFDLTVSYKF